MLRHIFSIALCASVSLPAFSSDDENSCGVLAFSAPVEDSRGWFASPRPSPFTEIHYVQFDQVHWKPERLDSQVQNTIHGWLRHASEATDTKQQYKYLLSSACLGHQESLLLAGAYLLADKNLRVQTLAELPGTVAKKMLTRLNQPISSNSRLVQSLDKLHGVLNTTFDPFMGLREINKVRSKLKGLLYEKGSLDEDEQLFNARIKDLVREFSFLNAEERVPSCVKELMRNKPAKTVLWRLYRLPLLKTFDAKFNEGAALIEETLNGYVIGEVCQILRRSLSPGQISYFDVLRVIQSWGLMGALLGDARSMNEFWVASERLEDYEKAPILAFLEQYLELVNSKDT